jgi:hypothetical protein
MKLLTLLLWEVDGEINGIDEGMGFELRSYSSNSMEQTPS